MSVKVNSQEVHNKLNELRLNDRISYEKLAKCIDYSGVGVSKALKNGTLSVGQINIIISEFEWHKHFQSNTIDKKSIDSQELLAQISPDEICIYIFENRHIFQNNRVYQMLLDNELKDSIIKELEKQKRDLEERK